MLDLFSQNVFRADDSAVSPLSRRVPARPTRGCSAQITDAVRMPIGTASSVVRHYATTLTDEPERGRAHHARAPWSAGRGRSTAATSAARCPRTSRGGRSPGWSWADVLPHFRAIETRSGLRRTRCTGPTGRYSCAGSPNSTAAQHRSLNAATEMGYRLGRRSQRCDAGRAAAAGSRRGAAEHRRRHPDRARRRLPAARARSAQSDAAWPTPAWCGSGSIEGGRSAVDCVGPDGAVRADGGSNRVVRRCNRIGTSPDAVRYRPRGVCWRAGIPVVVDLAGRACGRAIIPNGCCRWTGRRPTTCPPLEAVLTTPNGLEIRPYTRGFGAMVGGRRRRSGRPAAHRCRADAAPVARQGQRGVRRPDGAADHRAPLRQRARTMWRR